MKKSVSDILTTSALLNTAQFEGGCINDDRVFECIMDMRFYMLYNGIGNEEKKEEYLNEFGEKYNNLNEEQQEQVKKEYKDIIEAQDRGKVKKKGMINNE